MGGTYLRVGLLLVGGAAVAVGLVLFLGRNRISEGVRFESYFAESVQGLDVGAPVKFRGVTLGQVAEIRLASATYPESSAATPAAGSRMVVVRYLVDPSRVGPEPDISAEVAQGLRIRLASQGITGLAYLELDYVDPARFPERPVHWTPLHPHLPSMPSTISQFQDAAQALAAKLQNVDIAGLAASVQALVNDSRAQLEGGDLNRALAEAAELLRVLRGGVEAADLPRLAGDLRAAAGSLRSLAEGGQARELLVSATRTSDRLGEAAARLPLLIATLEAAVRRVNNGAADTQAELLPTLRDARAAAANLRDTSEALRRYPASVLLGGPPPRPAR